MIKNELEGFGLKNNKFKTLFILKESIINVELINNESK